MLALLGVAAVALAAPPAVGASEVTATSASGPRTIRASGSTMPRGEFGEHDALQIGPLGGARDDRPHAGGGEMIA